MDSEKRYAQVGERPEKPRVGAGRILRDAVRRWRLLVFRAQVGWKKVCLGRNVTIGRGSEVYAPQYFVVGSDVSIGSRFLSQVNVKIGNGVLISSNVALVGDDHYVLEAEYAYFSGRKPPASMDIKDGVFVGFGATILGGINIGEGAVIGAGALVNRDVGDYEIVAGVPARVIGHKQQRSLQQGGNLSA